MPRGRKSLEGRRTTVTLPDVIYGRIDAVAGPNRRGVFIRQAIERELARREREAGAAGKAVRPRASAEKG